MRKNEKQRHWNTYRLLPLFPTTNGPSVMKILPSNTTNVMTVNSKYIGIFNIGPQNKMLTSTSVPKKRCVCGGGGE
jgi:hypothetical protein